MYVSTVMREFIGEIKSKHMIRGKVIDAKKAITLLVHWLQNTNQWNTEIGKTLNWSWMKKSHSEKGDPVFCIDQPFASYSNWYTVLKLFITNCSYFVTIANCDYWHGVWYFFRSLFMHLLRWIQKYTMSN